MSRICCSQNGAQNNCPSFVVPKWGAMGTQQKLQGLIIELNNNPNYDFPRQEGGSTYTYTYIYIYIRQSCLKSLKASCLRKSQLLEVIAMTYAFPETSALVRRSNQCIPHLRVEVEDSIEQLVRQDNAYLPAKPFTKVFLKSF